MYFPHLNSYLSGYRQSEIFRDARSNLCFKHGSVSFQDYKKNHCYTGWVGRKFTALPKALWHGVIKTIYHLACVIFYGIPTAPGYNGAYIHIYFSYIARDLQASFGSLATLGSDRYGQFHVIDSKFQALCYGFFIHSEWKKTKRTPDKPYTSPPAVPQPPKDTAHSFNQSSKKNFATDADIGKIFEERFFNASSHQFPQGTSFPSAFSAGASPFFFSQSESFGFNFGSFNFENVHSSNPQRETHYSTLGLSKNASSKEIKSAYHNLVKQHHPDKVSKLPAHNYKKRLEESTNKFHKIDQAYKALT